MSESNLRLLTDSSLQNHIAQVGACPVAMRVKTHGLPHTAM